MSLKILFLHSHQDIFLENCAALGNEHGKHFHCDMSTVEKRYQGRWPSPMFAFYSWRVTRDSLGLVNKWQAKW
jgi:hypothetical protein